MDAVLQLLFPEFLQRNRIIRTGGVFKGWIEGFRPCPFNRSASKIRNITDLPPACVGCDRHLLWATIHQYHEVKVQRSNLRAESDAIASEWLDLDENNLPDFNGVRGFLRFIPA
jgi:hypothetical protein